MSGKSGPRQRYPSDDARSRPFVRIHLTTRNHPTYAGVFADPTLRGMAYGLWQVARGAYAGKTDDVVTLTSGDVNWICGTTEIRYGLPRLEHLCDLLGYPLVSHQRDASSAPAPSQLRASSAPVQRLYRVTIRNFERKQFPYSAIPRSTITRTKTSNEDEDDSERSADAPRAPSPEAIEFAGKFRASLKSRTPDAKLPSEAAFARWILEADRMFRIDDRKPEDAEELARWLFNDPGDDAAFWRGNVRAVPKFRTRFEELREHRTRGSRKKEKTDGGRDDALAAGQRYAERHGLRGLARK